MPAATIAPKPGLPMAPGAPRPAGAPSPGAVAKAIPEAMPVSIKPGSPKKETARIQIAPEPKELPKATVKLQQTQPLMTAPAAPVRQTSFAPMEPSEDPLVKPLSIGAFVCSLIALLIQAWTFFT